jgi:hypothetical protein
MEQLLIGPTYTLLPGTVYAMPARRVLMFVQPSGGTLNVSGDNSNFTAITLTDNKIEMAAPWVKNTSTNTNTIVRLVAL